MPMQFKLYRTGWTTSTSFDGWDSGRRGGSSPELQGCERQQQAPDQRTKEICTKHCIGTCCMGWQKAIRAKGHAVAVQDMPLYTS